jgi:hypothetical protein
MQYPQLPTWSLLINMLTSDKERDTDAAVKCLQVLTSGNKRAWVDILNAGGVEKLFNILRKYSVLLSKRPSPPPPPSVQQRDETSSSSLVSSSQTKAIALADNIALNTISVLCNLSDEGEVKACLGAIPDLVAVLLKILDLSVIDDVQSRVAILIGDVSSANDQMKVQLAKQNCLIKLLNMLSSDVEDLLINAINSIEIMCRGNADNQTFCVEHNVLACFISLLSLNSDFLRAAVAAAVASICSEHYANQMMAVEQGLIKPICELLKSRNITVQLKAAMAVESLALNNQKTQDLVLATEAADCLIRLLEVKIYKKVYKKNFLFFLKLKSRLDAKT